VAGPRWAFGSVRAVKRGVIVMLRHQNAAGNVFFGVSLRTVGNYAAPPRGPRCRRPRYRSARHCTGPEDHWPYKNAVVLAHSDGNQSSRSAIMGNNTETQPVGEPRTEYCRTCGHAKDTHNLDFRGDPKEAHKLYGQGDYVCQHMTGSKSAEHCICVGWSSWF
jgi:hypothetical protein